MRIEVGSSGFDLSARSGALPEQVYQLLAGLHPFGTLIALMASTAGFVIQYSSLCTGCTRYVARGVLLAAAWLQGRGRSRQASVTGPMACRDHHPGWCPVSPPGLLARPRARW